MVTRWAMLAVLLAGCFDPSLPPECAQRICGAVEKEESTPGQMAGGAGGVGGAPGVGGSGGSIGGAGGEAGAGGAGPVTVDILSPTDGAVFGIDDTVLFECEVVGAQPAIDQIRWRSSLHELLFGTSCMFSRSLGVPGAHEIRVRVFQDGVEVATDSIVVTAQ